MVSAGSKASKFVEESGFSEELKEQLQERIKASSFRSEHASAFAEVNMSVGYLQRICTALAEPPL